MFLGQDVSELTSNLDSGEVFFLFPDEQSYLFNIGQLAMYMIIAIYCPASISIKVISVEGWFVLAVMEVDLRAKWCIEGSAHKKRILEWEFLLFKITPKFWHLFICGLS